MPKHYLKKLDKQRLVALIIILIITMLGVRLIVSSHAQSPYASVSASAGSLAPPAQSEPDPTSVSGTSVQFGYTPTTALAVHVDGDQLVNGEGKVMRLLGVNSSSTEFCTITNTVSGDAPLNKAEADGIAAWKINAVRIPLNEDCWLGINGVSINGESASASAQTYQTAVEQWVSYLNQDGIVAILDLHWAAPGNYEAEQQWPMADEDHSPTFWTQVATAFKSNPAVMFDLVNEPFLGNSETTVDTTDWGCWLNGCNATFTDTIKGVDSSGTTSSVTYATAGMQQLVNTVRATGAQQPIILGGLDTASDPCGTYNKHGSTAACPEVANMPTDPAHQLAIDYHNYVLTSGSSLSSYESHWNAELDPIQAAGYPMVTDEFGEYDCSDTFMNYYMDWADQNNQSYLAWSWTPSFDSSPTCTTGSTAYVNFALIGDWDGTTPSTVIPQGANYQAHLAQVSPY